MNNTIRVKRKKPEHDLRFRRNHRSFWFCNVTPGLRVVSSVVNCLTRFGYHTYFPDRFVVIHLATGTPLIQYPTEKEAKIKAKRLETGLDEINSIDGTLSNWTDTQEDVPF